MNKRRVLMNYFSSYAVLVLLVGALMLSLGTLYISRQSAARELASQELKLEQARLSIDRHMQLCMNICNKLANDPSFFASKCEGDDPSWAKMLELQKYFMADLSRDLLIIYADEGVNYFYSPIGSMRLDKFDSVYNMHGLSLFTLREYAQSLATPRLLPTTYYSESAYALLIPMGALNPASAALAVFVISEDYIGKICEASFSNIEGASLTLYQSGEPLALYGAPGADSATELTVRSTFGSWTYTARIPRAGALASELISVALVGISVILLGLMTGYRLAKKNARPINKLIDKFGINAGGDVFGSISATVDELIARGRLRSDGFSRSALAPLLLGCYDSIPGDELSDILMLPDDARSFIMLLVSPAAPIPDIAGDAWLRECAFAENDQLAIMAAFESETALRWRAGDIISAFDSTRAIAVSEPFGDISRAPIEFIRLKRALSFAFLRGPGVIYARDIPASGAGEPSPVMPALARLYQSIMDNQFDVARYNAQEILRALENEFSPALLSAVMRDLSLVMSRCASGRWEIEIAEISAAGTIGELRERVTALIDRFEADGRSERAELNRDALVRLIRERYTDGSFSLASLSDAFGVSPSAMSRLIKATIGCTLTDYVTGLRIEKAKRMLADTNIPISRIVEEVGYNDINNFYRRFKAVTGTTPASYRAGAEG